MTSQKFIDEWRNSSLNEKQGAQTHFNGLCELLGVPPPTGTSLKDDGYGFEVNVDKVGGGQGYADAWKRGCFAWEYKSPNGDLKAALKQLKLYASDLENPPLLIVSDMRRIEIHTNWTSQVQESHVLELEDLKDVRLRQKLLWAFSEETVHELKPRRSANATTEEVAKQFVSIAQNLRERGHDPEKVAHFVNRMVFCMFAEDVDLLPKKMFERMLEASLKNPDEFVANAQQLFTAMAQKHGRVGYDAIDWFNGGLFEDGAALPLTRDDIRVALEAAKQNWAEINPSIMGTLFERGLDPGKRSQLGAHYTDAEKIMMIIRPVIIEPLLREWQTARDEIEAKLAKAVSAKSASAKTTAKKEAEALRIAFIERLKNFRVLDPACGSGNFLYLALKSLKDIEARVNIEAESLGLSPAFPSVGPECVKGIEINPFAAELARVSVWIGEIQWMREKGFGVSKNPILKSLETIECRDALLNPDGTEAEWPEADVIIGNPPFLGAKLMKSRLGNTREESIKGTETLRTLFDGRLSGFTDLVCYWFEKSRSHICSGKAKRAGLVATNSIAKNTNLPVMRRIADDLTFYSAWHDQPWIIDGASVRVALACFAAPDANLGVKCLDGSPVEKINPNLTSGLDVSVAENLDENADISLLGIQKSGPFDVDGVLARKWLELPSNPNGRRNSIVLRPYWNGDDLTERCRDKWIIDFPRELTSSDASAFEAPFEYLRNARYDPTSEEDKRLLKEARAGARDEHAQIRWWEQYWPRPEMRRAIESLSRYLVTGETTEHRTFVWLKFPVVPDKNLIVFARDDDTAFGILQSRVHEAWSTGIGNRMGVGNQRRYNSSYIFETFPFPEGLTPNIPAAQYAADPRAQAIAKAASRLNELRENWLNPPDLVQRVPEVVPTAEQREAGAKKIYPDRILPVDDKAAAILKNRTLTKLYNERPAWLDHAHKDLDSAVAAAYGWVSDLTDEQILEKLFALNQERAGKQ